MTETCVIQVTNVSPSTTSEQMATFFSFVGSLTDVIIYPKDENIIQTQSKTCYIRFKNSESVSVAQHLSNTVFIDRALIVTPVFNGKIPDEFTSHNLTSGLNAGSNEGLINQIITNTNGSQVISTIDPRLSALGLPQYPVLPANTDPSKIEEIRRTVQINNLDPNLKAEDILKFFNQIGEVKYIRLTKEDNILSRVVFVEFTEQSSVASALQYNGSLLGTMPLKINHSTIAILKPFSARNSNTQQKEIEETMKRVRDSQASLDQPNLIKLDSLFYSNDQNKNLSSSNNMNRKSSRSRSRSRRRSISRSRRRSSSRNRRRSRERIRSRERNRSRERIRERDRERDRDRDRDRERDRDRDKDRERDRERDRGRDRDRRVASWRTREKDKYSRKSRSPRRSKTPRRSRSPRKSRSPRRSRTPRSSKTPRRSPTRKRSRSQERRHKRQEKSKERNHTRNLIDKIKDDSPNSKLRSEKYSKDSESKKADKIKDENLELKQSIINSPKEKNKSSKQDIEKLKELEEFKRSVSNSPSKRKSKTNKSNDKKKRKDENKLSDNENSNSNESN